jgi:heme-degrading monooxygenase HmoA
VVARTTTWSGSPDALDKWAEHVKDQVAGFVSGLPGNRGGAFLINQHEGTALTLTLWESEAAAAETDRFAERSRERTVAATGVELIEKSAYEVVLRFWS